MSDEPNDNRTRILDVGEALFADKGYAGTSVREIVRAAGVTNPMLYYYFGSKEDLFVTLLRDRFSWFHQEVEAAIGDATTPREIMRRWLSTAIRMVTERPTSIRFVNSAMYGPSAGVPSQQIAELGAGIGTLFDTKLTAACPDVSDGTRRVVALLFHGAVSQLIRHFMHAFCDGTREALIEAIVDRIALILDDERSVDDSLIGALALPEVE